MGVEHQAWTIAPNLPEGKRTTCRVATSEDPGPRGGRFGDALGPDRLPTLAPDQVETFCRSICALSMGSWQRTGTCWKMLVHGNLAGHT